MPKGEVYLAQNDLLRKTCLTPVRGVVAIATVINVIITVLSM